MKNKKLLLSLYLLILLLPLNVFAKENEILIDCDNYFLSNNDEATCKIEAKNFDFTATSVTGQIKLDENLKLIDSNYDNKMWKILDEEFDVSDINLISENKNIESNFTIATFKIKAINDSETVGKIQFINVSIGDENYESHDISVEDKNIDLKYDKVNEEINKNPTTKDIPIIILITGIILSIGCFIYFIKKKKEK